MAKASKIRMFSCARLLLRMKIETMKGDVKDFEDIDGLREQAARTKVALTKQAVLVGGAS